MIPTPFTNIALSLSGGGYRATTFHLGAMSYLNSKEFDGHNLLEHVRIISTISGGTITGVMYAYKLSQGGNFKDCFDKLYQLLSEDKLVDNALHKLNQPGKWKNKYKSRDMINAFSEVYNEDFFDEATFEALFDAKANHLTDAIFGASEFTYGIQFRLQKNHHNARFGNGYLNLPDEVAKQIRLADATAVSSCFPGGFEPMIMPKDFGNGPESDVDKVWNSKSHKDVPYQPTAVMDGGIVDNQGIEGVKLSEEREAKRHGKPFIGTYIVSDVSGDVMKPYVAPVLENSTFQNLITINRINILVLLTIIGIAFASWFGLSYLGVVIVSVLSTMIVSYAILYFVIKNNFKKAVSGGFGEDAVPELMKDFGVIKRTPLYIIFYLVKFRASSVVKMVSNLFLRRIRRLQLEKLYADEDWNYRFKSNYIYALQRVLDTLSEPMQKVIKMANNMPTTLWFTTKEKNDKMLDHLIAAGQITLCHNLIKYVDRIKSDRHKDKVWNPLSEKDKRAIDQLEHSMKEDWERFSVNPFWLLEMDKGQNA